MRLRAGALVIGLVALASACGSTKSSPTSAGVSTSTPTSSSATTVLPADPEGVPAHGVTTDVPFRLVATPSHVHVGDRLVLSATGDTSGGWESGVDTQVDLQVDGSWRTLWWIVDEEFKSVIQPVGGGAEATVPAKGVAITTPVAFVIPADLAPRQYRFCRYFVKSGGEEANVCAFAFVVKD